MSQYIAMAEKIRSDFDGEDINKYISKYASDNNLNDNEKQRLVEEVNVGTFLDKLKDGEQHEDFPVADSVITHADGDKPVLESAELNKAASFSNFDIDSSMFELNFEKDTYTSPVLRKEASVEIGSEIMNSEDKWEEAERLRQDVISDFDKGLAKEASEDTLYNELGELMKIANISEGMTKTAIAVLKMNELDELALSLAENSKHSTSDILSSEAEPLAKEASDILSSLLEKTSKNILKDTKEAIGGLKNLIMYPVKHPVVAAGTVGTGMYLNSDRMNMPDKERMNMSLRSFNNE